MEGVPEHPRLNRLPDSANNFTGLFQPQPSTGLGGCQDLLLQAVGHAPAEVHDHALCLGHTAHLPQQPGQPRHRQALHIKEAAHQDLGCGPRAEPRRSSRSDPARTRTRCLHPPMPPPDSRGSAMVLPEDSPGRTRRPQGPNGRRGAARTRSSSAPARHNPAASKLHSASIRPSDGLTRRYGNSYTVHAIGT